MSANENLFRVTKHINTFNKTYKVVNMNIYEIVALNEIEIPSGAVAQAAPGVNPTYYRVTYPPEMGRLPDVVTGEDAARQRYTQEVDNWNKNSRQRKQELRRENRQRAVNRRERARQDRARAR